MFSYRLKNYFTFLIFLSAFATFYSQRDPSVNKATPSALTMKAGAFIDVNVPPYPASSYTAAQLIENVLIKGNSSCVSGNISNVIVSPNTSPSDPDRTWGYFNKGTTNFPFDDGIVMVSGPAHEAGNSFISGVLSGGPTTTPDPDLIAAINPLATLYNSTFIQFDFIPSSTQITFNYLFASEEYTSSFPCGNFSDGFALLIKPVGAPNYTNMAILPGGGGPVSVTNIVPATPYSCGPINAAYFAGHNTANIETNFAGRTIPLTATATVVPGQAYTFKMVIADASDSSYNSGVFIEGGSFDIGLTLVDPGGATLPAEIQMCDNDPKTLISSVQIPGALYQWSLNGQDIAGATSPTYVATQPGEYCLEIMVPNNQCPAVVCINIVGGNAPIVQDVEFVQCYGPDAVSYNLTHTQPYITSTQGVTFAYYANLADAQAQNGNTIPNPTNYMSPGGVSVYALVKSTFCPAIAKIDLVKAPEMIADIAQPPGINCIQPQVNLNATASVFPAGSVISWEASNGGYIYSGANTLTPVVTAGGRYTLTITKAYAIGDIACTVTAFVDVHEDFSPPSVTVTASDMRVCAGDPVVLSGVGGQNFVWSHSASTSADITVNPTQTTTYTVYAVGLNGCQSTTPASITIEVIPAINTILQPIAGQICVGDQITLDAGFNENYTYTWSKVENSIPSVIGTGQTITVDQIGTYKVTIENGECEATFETKVITAELPQITNADYQSGTLTITASNPSFTNPLEYSIDNGFTWQESNVFTGVQDNTTLMLMVRIKNTSCVTIKDFFTLHIPNIITPNGDGKNDELDFSAISRFEDFEVFIFDRYGKKIWEAAKNAPVWDGRFQGRALSTATYWYQVKYKDPVSDTMVLKKGWVLLKNRE